MNHMQVISDVVRSRAILHMDLIRLIIQPHLNPNCKPSTALPMTHNGELLKHFIIAANIDHNDVKHHHLI